MAENDKPNQESELEKGDETLGIDVSAIDKDEPTGKAILTARAQRDHWREKAKTLGDQTKDPTTGKSYKELYDEAKTKVATPTATQNGNASEPQPQAGLNVESVLKLRKDGFSEAEILDLNEKSKQLGIPVDKLLSDATFRAGIEAERRKAKVNAGTPPPGSRGGFQASDANSPQSKYANAKNDAERKAAFNEMTSGSQGDE